MSSTASVISQGSNLIDQSQASSSSSSAVGAPPSIGQSLYNDALRSIFENLGKSDLTSVHRTCRHWNNALKVSRENIFKNQLLHHLLPGIKEDQLSSNLIKYTPKGSCKTPFSSRIWDLIKLPTIVYQRFLKFFSFQYPSKEGGYNCLPNPKKISYEETYKAISRVKYGVEFLSSIGVRTVEPEGPIPAYLLEKRYLPTHRVEVPAGSTLGLTSQGKLTTGPQNPANPADPGHYAPAGHRYSLARIKVDQFLEFPNTQPNREFLAANPSLVVGPLNYPMQSPLEQGSPILAFQPNLEIDVLENSPLRVTPEGILTEEPGPKEPGVNGIRTVRFSNTPHNWLILAAPDPDNSSITKYLNKNAKPVKTDYVFDGIQPIWDTPAPAGWIAPAAKLIALGDTYLHAEEEALALEQRPMTFHQDSIHRILTQIRGNSDLYPHQYSRTSTDIISSWGTTYKAGTHMYAAVGPAAPARVFLNYFVIDLGSVGLVAAWGPAGSP
jgi:hypothetical protein